MDPRISKLIEGVRQTHTSLLWFPKEVFPHMKPVCSGCINGTKPESIVLLEDCPVLKAAKELEDESESDSD